MIGSYIKTDSKPLSYQSSKAVLKHLDYNSRFQLHEQCPSLRNVLKVTPGYMNRLEFDEDCVKINGTTYQLKMTPVKLESTTNHIQLWINGKLHAKTVSEHKKDEALAYVACKLLRQTWKVVLYVGTLVYEYSFFLGFPKFLKVHVQHLVIGEDRDASHFLQKFGENFRNSSFKTLELFSTSSFEVPLIQSAEKLIISKSMELSGLKNRRVHVEFKIDSYFLTDLIDCWLGNGVMGKTEKEAGSVFTFAMKGFREARMIVDNVKMNFEGKFYVDKRWSNYKPCFEFPMRNSSSLQLDYCVEDEKVILVMRVE